MAILIRTLTVVTHQAEEGGYWAEVLELPGCVSQGETLEELHSNIREAIEAVLQEDADSLHFDLQVESAPAEIRIGSPVQGWRPGDTGTWTAAPLESTPDEIWVGSAVKGWRPRDTGTRTESH